MINYFLVLFFLSIEYYYSSVEFDCPAIQQLALKRLKTVVDDYFALGQKQQAYSLSASYRGRDRGEVVYVSNVAFALGKFLNIPPLEIATDFATFYAQVYACEQDFATSVVPPGSLQLKLTELKLASWLQQLPFLQLSLTHLPVLESNYYKHNLDLFAIQYAHARCHSLLRLAHKEGLITLETISVQKIKSLFPNLNIAPSEDSILIINHPQPIPWLDCSQNLCFSDRAEYMLIIQLVKAIDNLCASKQVNLNYWAKTALNVSQAFEEFYSCCRIFDKTNIQLRDLAQARLGLILATSVVLKLLLQRSGVFAPQEL